MNQASQALEILRALKKGERLTPMDALDRFGCLRLGARIWDLRKEGHTIHSETVEVGDGKRVSRYFLDDTELTHSEPAEQQELNLQSHHDVPRN